MNGRECSGAEHTARRARQTLIAAVVLCAIQSLSAGTALDPRLPRGSDRDVPFGAYYDKLSYSPEWDAPWSVGPDADVVVRFGRDKPRLIFWRGANFIPCWVNDRGAWYSDGAVVRGPAGPQNDRLCRYSFASVVESSDARVVVRWRYALVDPDGKLINLDPVTRWNDWVDELYTLYPDATGVRRITLHSSNWEQPISCQQSILLSEPGQRVPRTGVRLSGTAPNAKNIQVVNCTGSRPFQVVAPEGAQFQSGLPVAANWSDWPAAGATEKPGHHFLGGISWKPFAEDRTSKSWLMLVGQTRQRPAQLEPVARAWLAAPALKLNSEGFSSAGYDVREKSYQLACDQPGAPRAIRFSLEANANAPVINPAFVIKGWGRSAAALTLNGRHLKQGSDFCAGFRKTSTVSDLILWVRRNSPRPVALEIKPIASEQK